jgi:hypothetical protein
LFFNPVHGHTLELVTSAKYLGLTITNKLQWDQHINNIIAKANKTLGFLRRNLKIPSIRIKEQAVLFVTLRTLHLSGWNFIHHSFSHWPSLLRSSDFGG